MADIASSKEYKAITGNTLSLTKEGDSDILVQVDQEYGLGSSHLYVRNRRSRRSCRSNCGRRRTKRSFQRFPWFRKQRLKINQLTKKKFIKKRSAVGPVYFINNYARISHPQKGLIPFKTYDFQSELLNDFTIIVLTLF